MRKIYIRDRKGKFSKSEEVNYTKCIILALWIVLTIVLLVQVFYKPQPYIHEVEASETSATTTEILIDKQEIPEIAKIEIPEVQEVATGTVLVTAIVLTDVYPESHDDRHIVISEYMKQLGETDEEIKVWNCILEGESRGTNHDLYTQGIEWYGDSAKGPFQIMDITWLDNNCGSRDSWMENVRCAVANKDKKGFGDWEAYYNYNCNI